MTSVLIEDNPAARRSFMQLVQEYCPDIQVLGEASNVSDGVTLITKEKPELVFLDIEMPDGTGFDMLKKLPEINFQLIFVSSHEKYALRAIKHSALDYILKPIDPDELIEATRKAKSEILDHRTSKKIQTLLHNTVEHDKVPTKLVLKDKYGIQIVQIKDIVHLEANGSYTKFYIHDQESILVSKGLKEYENILSKEQFFRCHQSHLINLNHLLRYDKRNGGFLITKDGSEIPLASRKKDSFLKIINS
ncbi:LytR/AlgR family response regulator transcription factor [Aquimarina algiphila]|uniref:LytR/AlgR family response regulator transcription factor n=1 Tax=Aquimarina algiphila TaxID=2047982 RepID=UPI00232B64AC|nr:LytTR family DNA-binding domain-containing protein [Aquimarina algiphila]